MTVVVVMIEMIGRWLCLSLSMDVVMLEPEKNGHWLCLLTVVVMIVPAKNGHWLCLLMVDASVVVDAAAALTVDVTHPDQYCLTIEHLLQSLLIQTCCITVLDTPLSRSTCVNVCGGWGDVVK
jgi:hypothetical protein